MLFDISFLVHSLLSFSKPGSYMSPFREHYEFCIVTCTVCGQKSVTKHGGNVENLKHKSTKKSWFST